MKQLTFDEYGELKFVLESCTKNSLNRDQVSHQYNQYSLSQCFFYLQLPLKQCDSSLIRTT